MGWVVLRTSVLAELLGGDELDVADALLGRTEPVGAGSLNLAQLVREQHLPVRTERPDKYVPDGTLDWVFHHDRYTCGLASPEEDLQVRQRLRGVVILVDERHSGVRVTTELVFRVLDHVVEYLLEGHLDLLVVLLDNRLDGGLAAGEGGRLDHCWCGHGVSLGCTGRLIRCCIFILA